MNWIFDGSFESIVENLKLLENRIQILEEQKSKKIRDKAIKYSDEFLEFWKLWPGRYNTETLKIYKVGKAQAAKVWERLSVKSKQQALAIIRTNKIKAAGTKYLPDAFRWLDKKRWEDFEKVIR